MSALAGADRQHRSIAARLLLSSGRGDRMKVLLTAGAGPGPGSVTRTLLLRGHTVRLLSPLAAREAMGWPHGVEGWPGDIASAADVSGAASGCDAVVHMAE